MAAVGVGVLALDATVEGEHSGAKIGENGSISFLCFAIMVMATARRVDLLSFADLQSGGFGRLWFLPLAFSGEFINGGPKLASLPRPHISWSTGGPRPRAQPPLEALFNLALELAITSSPRGSSPEAL
jgi:hypothetical protein